MNRLFQENSPVIRFLTGFADLIGVNLLLIVFSIPIVTMGAAITAALRVTRDIAKDEAAHIFRTFWRAFRENFRQATIVWIPYAVLLVGLGWDIYLFQFLLDESAYQKMLILLIVLLVMTVGTGVYLFMLISRFENTVMQQVKNALAMFFHYLPLSILLACLNGIPAVLFVVSPYLFLQTFVVWTGFGFALICMLNNIILKSAFSVLEKRPEG